MPGANRISFNKKKQGRRDCIQQAAAEEDDKPFECIAQSFCLPRQSELWQLKRTAVCISRSPGWTFSGDYMVKQAESAFCSPGLAV